MNIAASERMRKEAHPALYCAHPRCLWRIVTSRGPNPCQRHPVKTDEVQERGGTAEQSQIAVL